MSNCWHLNKYLVYAANIMGTKMKMFPGYNIISEVAKKVPHVIHMAFSQHELSCRFTGTFDRRSQDAKLENAALRSPLSIGVAFIPIRWFLIFFISKQPNIVCSRVVSISVIATERCGRHSLRFCACESIVLRLSEGAGPRVQSEWKGGGSSSVMATERCGRHSLRFTACESMSVSRLSEGAGLRVQSEWKGGGSHHLSFALSRGRTQNGIEGQQEEEDFASCQEAAQAAG